MSRYYDSGESTIPAELWWAIIDRSLKCGRGQKFLAEFEAALLAMPDKKLVVGEIATASGEVCAIGAFARFKNPAALEKYRGRDPDTLGLDETAELGVQCGIARSLAWGIGYHNDETFITCTPDQRYVKMLEWVRENQIPLHGTAVAG